MSITITLPDSFEVENYTGLQSFLTDHLELPQSVVDQLPTLIRLAESRLARKLKTPEREATTTLSTAAGSQTVALPSDYEYTRQLKLSGEYPLKLVSLEKLEDYDVAGKPAFYAIHGETLLLGPVPDAIYTLVLRYQAKLTPLTQNTQVNWLLAGHPDAYVYMCAAVINTHLENKDAAAMYLAFAEGVIEEINAQGVMHRQAGHMQPMVVGTP